MARSIAEVEADLSEVEGVKGKGFKVGTLRKELIEAQRAWIDAVKADTFGSVGQRQMVEADTIIGASVPYNTGTLAAPDPQNSEEWRFIEKVCAELALDLKSGSSAGIVKGVFNIVDAKVKAWRIARRIFEQIGAGGDWPQYTALGLKATTGAPEHEHSILSDDWVPHWKPEPAEKKAPAPPVDGPPAPVGGPASANVPPGFFGAGDEMADMVAGVQSAMAGEIDKKGEPDLELAKSEG